MPMRLTSKKVFVGAPRGTIPIKIGMSMQTPINLAEHLDKEVRVINMRAAKELAERIFRESQLNIQKMRIADRGFLALSGYTHKIENGYVVGYSAEHAEYVNSGTGPKAGHGPYSAPPPYDPIYQWVKRNIAILAEEQIRPTTRKSSKTGYRKSWKRVRDKHGNYIVKIKPYKAPRESVAQWRKVNKTDNREIQIERITNKIRYKIYGSGTSPKPFFTDAVNKVMAKKDEITREILTDELKKGAGSIFHKGIMNALKAGIRIWGGGLKKW